MNYARLADAAAVPLTGSHYRNVFLEAVPFLGNVYGHIGPTMDAVSNLSTAAVSARTYVAPALRCESDVATESATYSAAGLA